MYGHGNVSVSSSSGQYFAAKSPSCQPSKSKAESARRLPGQHSTGSISGSKMVHLFGVNVVCGWPFANAEVVWASCWTQNMILLEKGCFWCRYALKSSAFTGRICLHQFTPLPAPRALASWCCARKPGDRTLTNMQSFQSQLLAFVDRYRCFLCTTSCKGTATKIKTCMSCVFPPLSLTLSLSLSLSLSLFSLSLSLSLSLSILSLWYLHLADCTPAFPIVRETLILIFNAGGDPPICMKHQIVNWPKLK